MDHAARAPGEPGLYRAAFLAGCSILAASGVAGLLLAVTGRDRLPGLGRLDPQAAAEAFHASGDLAAAARELHMLTAIDPGDCRSFDALAQVLAGQGDLEGSLRVQLRHVTIHPYSAAAHTGLGMAFQRLSRVADAFGSFSMALRLNPGDAVALTALGDIARLQGRLDEAIAVYERALRLGHEPARLHNKLAIAHALGGQRDRALRHFGEALRLEPGFEEARINLARLGASGAASLAEAR